MRLRSTMTAVALAVAACGSSSPRFDTSQDLVSSTSAPTTTTTTAAVTSTAGSEAVVHRVFVNGFSLGGWDGEGFVPPLPAGAPLPTGRLVDADTGSALVLVPPGEGPALCSVPDGVDEVVLEVGVASEGSDELARSLAIGVTDADWPLSPRPAVEVIVDDEHRRLVRDALDERGADVTDGLERVTIVAWSVDLQGDGSNETVVAAGRGTGAITGPEPDDVDLLLVLGLGPGGDDAVLRASLASAGDHVLPLPSVAFADLNGDGVIEIVGRPGAAHDWAYHVWDVSSGEPMLVLDLVCGS